jgi:hypothetical protein
MMETQGINLVKISKFGTAFFFAKGGFRKIRYHLDYQRHTGPEYYNIHKESGWKLYFAKRRFNIWGQEYAREAPAFYSDKQSRLAHAKRVATTYTFMPLYFIVFYSIQTVMRLIFYPWNNYFIIFLGLFGTAICWFSLWAAIPIRYYLRIKRSVKAGDHSTGYNGDADK